MSLQELLAEVGRRADWIPNSAIAAAAFVVAAGLALAVHGALMRVVRRMLPTAWIFARTLIDATHRLTRLGLVILALAIVLPAVPIGPHATRVIAHLLFVGLIVLLGWAATTALTLATDYYLRRSAIGEGTEPLARKHVTQVRVLRRVMTTLAIIITVADALM